ncbi:hypothetical protein BDF20DRAFT_860675 [Mycotypha africana]|uniref:uncharacterized protein n=1 Tax=Mycotypha africana TaxID=64632 RepID=UPI002301B4E3|nr:uncharacterized protein BDF20DRAFT_860675 [Mycotypha africana]KAI8984579.1 hypothetical protein BDF20DRAFT_860675 [Mycotypha africana]
MEAQIRELIPFLHQPALEIRAIALHHLVPYSPNGNEYRHILIEQRSTVCKDMKLLVKEDPVTAHDALRCLINLSSDPQVQAELDDEDFVKYLGLLITNPKSVLADLACMLLSNMTKHEPTCVKVIQAKAKPVEGLNNSDRLLDQLIEVFQKGVKKEYNPEADFHFLASVFSNVSSIRLGRVFMVERSPADQLSPITKIQIFTEDPNIIRRGGVDSTIKNCCFETREHERLLDVDDINMLPFILLPLCGNEEYDMDEFEQFPEEIQLLDDDKKREIDPKLRAMLLEALLLLTSTRFGREYLRKKQVYRVIQRLHLTETDEEMKDKCVSIVEMLIRDEEGAEIKELKPKEDEQEEEEDEDMVIEEIA